jgi:hypothetical protein
MLYSAYSDHLYIQQEAFPGRTRSRKGSRGHEKMNAIMEVMIDRRIQVFEEFDPGWSL